MRLLAAAAAGLALTACGAGSIPLAPGRVHGHVTISPCTPVERFPPSPCPPAAGVKVAFGGFVTVTDAAGDYQVTLPPADYQVVVRAGVTGQGAHIRVKPGDDLTLDLDVDSGIR